MERFVIIDKKNNMNIINGGIQALKVFMWGRDTFDYSAYLVGHGGLSWFFVPSDLNLLDKFHGE